MIRLGDIVLYTAPGLSVRVAIVTLVNSDGSVELCSFSAREQRIEWLSNVRVVGALPGTLEAVGKWSPR